MPQIKQLLTLCIVFLIGLMIGLVSFWNGVEENIDCPWWNFWCTNQEIKIFNTVSNKFQVAPTSVPIVVPPYIQQGFSGFCDEMASGYLFGLDVAVCKAMVAVFVPSSASWDSNISQFKYALSQNLPFSGYFIFQSSLAGALATSTMSGDIDVDLGFWSGTMFSWQDAHDFWYTVTDNELGGQLTQIMVWVIVILVFLVMASTMQPKETI